PRVCCMCSGSVTLSHFPTSSLCRLRARRRIEAQRRFARNLPPLTKGGTGGSYPHHAPSSVGSAVRTITWLRLVPRSCSRPHPRTVATGSRTEPRPSGSGRQPLNPPAATRHRSRLTPAPLITHHSSLITSSP